MSTNCLFTKLKAEVENHNLPVFDGFTIPFTQKTWIGITRFGGLDAQHCVTGYAKNCEMYNTAKTQKLDNPHDSFYGNDYIVYIGDIQSNPYFMAKNITNLAYFQFDNFNRDSGQRTGITPEDWWFDCSCLANCTSMRELILYNCTAKVKTADLVKMTSVTKLLLPGFADATDVDIVTLVKAWIANGRSSSGSIIGYFENGCKFNGTPLSSYHAYVNRTLTWESASKIWLPAGNNILCVGYSDSEISTRTASGGVWEGKTVVKCN